MGASSKIEWTDATWNPIRARLKGSDRWGYHCERISPGCKHCYASTMNGRMLPAWGTGLDYTVPNREKVEIFLDEEELIRPLHWKKPRKIFPCSMTDWCADFVTDEMRDRMLAVAALCPQHTFLFLTKRAERCAEYFTRMRVSGDTMDCKSAVYDAFRRPARFFPRAFKTLPLNNDSAFLWPLPNVLLGFSAENQECFDERWNEMRPLAAAGWKVWCSAEPLLGPITMHYMDRLSWVVAGGESGHGARPLDVAWVRSIIRQCKDAGVSCFVKQLGAKPGQERDTKGDWHPWLLRDRKGGNMSEWAVDLHVREFPR